MLVKLDVSDTGCVLAFASREQQKELGHALDNICGTAGIVATGTGEFVHIRRFYSYSAGAGAGSARRQPSERTTKRGLAKHRFGARVS